MKLHDLAREGKTNTAAATSLLGGVERHEYLLYLALRNLGTVVGYGYAGLASGGRCHHGDAAVLYPIGCLDGITDNVYQRKRYKAGVCMDNNITRRLKTHAIRTGLGLEESLQVAENARHGDIGHRRLSQHRKLTV